MLVSEYIVNKEFWLVLVAQNSSWLNTISFQNKVSHCSKLQVLWFGMVHLPPGEDCMRPTSLWPPRSALKALGTSDPTLFHFHSFQVAIEEWIGVACSHASQTWRHMQIPGIFFLLECRFWFHGSEVEPEIDFTFLIGSQVIVGGSLEDHAFNSWRPEGWWGPVLRPVWPPNLLSHEPTRSVLREAWQIPESSLPTGHFWPLSCWQNSGFVWGSNRTGPWDAFWLY